MAPAPKYSQQEQQEKILQAAQTCIANSSLLEFKMSAISQEAGLSMGSVYKCIQTKEDVLVALATKMLTHMKSVFEDVLALPLTTPEKLIAIHLTNPNKLYLYPFGINLAMLIANEGLLTRASIRWTEKFTRIDTSMDTLFTSLLQHAIESGELNDEGDDDALIDEIIMGNRAMNTGFLRTTCQQISRDINERPHDSLTSPAVDSPCIKSAARLINGYDWKEPLSRERLPEICELLINKSLR